MTESLPWPHGQSGNAHKRKHSISKWIELLHSASCSIFNFRKIWMDSVGSTLVGRVWMVKWDWMFVCCLCAVTGTENSTKGKQEEIFRKVLCVSFAYVWALGTGHRARVGWLGALSAPSSSTLRYRCHFDGIVIVLRINETKNSICVLYNGTNPMKPSPTTFHTRSPLHHPRNSPPTW